MLRAKKWFAQALRVMLRYYAYAAYLHAATPLLRYFSPLILILLLRYGRLRTYAAAMLPRYDFSF